jgi:hypothetical protein
VAVVRFAVLELDEHGMILRSAQQGQRKHGDVEWPTVRALRTLVTTQQTWITCTRHNLEIKRTKSSITLSLFEECAKRKTKHSTKYSAYYFISSNQYENIILAFPSKGRKKKNRGIIFRFIAPIACEHEDELKLLAS